MCPLSQGVKNGPRLIVTVLRPIRWIHTHRGASDAENRRLVIHESGTPTTRARELSPAWPSPGRRATVDIHLAVESLADGHRHPQLIGSAADER